MTRLGMSFVMLWWGSCGVMSNTQEISNRLRWDSLIVLLTTPTTNRGSLDVQASMHKCEFCKG
jgi:hypothetical protein